MDAELLYTPDTYQDLDDAYAWYEKRRRGLGQEFLASVADCIRDICNMPESHGRVDGEYRRALVRRFP